MHTSRSLVNSFPSPRLVHKQKHAVSTFFHLGTFLSKRASKSIHHVRFGEYAPSLPTHEPSVPSLVSDGVREPFRSVCTPVPPSSQAVRALLLPSPPSLHTIASTSFSTACIKNLLAFWSLSSFQLHLHS
ncbi:uncharacterized protein M421DRAFT_419835 [Didymella exigua CBS 183.55]|uniref:Uncharacterized protein n=1 Tax=Didymella exigua CBS 183.55 TaxID=1150837 RepID=A0A6A5RLK4_9PLEO|nr:uncharacterized protein M421DRAFT_419835 [Didymella exigua CBS 183.55]KAF1929311.1 hypothetical protein M421DRAFT_419835 [Didymella exigua CBS 183.55]